MPSSKDIPQDFRVSFHDSKRNAQAGVLGSKAVGEQSLLMGVSAIFALRRAIDSIKRDLGQEPVPFYTLGNFPSYQLCILGILQGFFCSRWPCNT